MDLEGSIKIAAVHPQMGQDWLPFPERKTEQAVGFDCHAAIDEPLYLQPNVVSKVPLGFALSLPSTHEAQIRPRSGMASKGVIMPNAPGTIDSDYRGEVSALLLLLPVSEAWDHHFEINPGDRICQLVFARVLTGALQIVPRVSLGETTRGEGGFGSTGVK